MTSLRATRPAFPPNFPPDFARRLVQWQRQHGRHDLPWQGTRDPYRVWLSEIMLQQTQVSTVLDYYPRFLARFPDVSALAAARQPEVMGLWSGLGYYSRARNLHRCAQVVMQQHAGRFPRDSATLSTLPGIGPSTAAAIAAFCSGERAAILDGNVRRVLARVTGYEADLSRAAAVRELQSIANALLPADAADMPAYTQGLMDLGATVCTPRKPRCAVCPMSADCAARASGEPARLPVKTRTLRRQRVDVVLLFIRRADGAVWLQRRPQGGIWAGLLCVPEHADHASAEASLTPAQARRVRWLHPVRHVLTHRDLDIHAGWLDWTGRADPRMPGQWALPQDWAAEGLPVPVRRMLDDSMRSDQG